MQSTQRIALLALTVSAFLTPALRADSILFTDNYGNASATIPAYYVGGCTGVNCDATEGYPFSVLSNSIPALLYVGDPSGNVSDKIVSTVGPPSSCTPAPACFTEITSVQFAFTSGLDLTGPPVSCASVGGCAFTYDGAVQDIATIAWGPGLFTPPSGYGDTTTLQFQSLTGTLLTQTLTSFLGGSSADPQLLPGGEPVGQVTGTIGGFGSEDYYSFLWSGGVFNATASIGGTPNPSASYLFSEGATGCTSGTSATLDSGDSFTGTIAIADLPAGEYCIGIDANDPADPPYTITFNTPVEGVTPEPSTFLSLAIGLAALLRFKKMAGCS